MANWTTLFASPADCECNDCNSVFSPAAYLVDIMEYLDHCDSNGAGSKSVLQVLFERRPDIGNLLLTCENTNTEIPYIDLVNEIMEYYVAHSQNNAIPFNAGDTGNATAEELQAEPQYILMDAYKQVYQKVYPFNLPYHQPLDVVRAYLQFLKTSRAEIMEVFGRYPVYDNSNPPQITDISPIPSGAVDAEWMQLSLLEYEVLTLNDFSGNPNSPQSNVEGYFGNPNPQYTNNGIAVTDLLQRTGLQYTDVLAIVETRFINPGQDAWNVLQNLLSATSGIAAADAYTALKTDYQNLTANSNSALSSTTNTLLANSNIDQTKFIPWLLDNFISFQQTITLYESTSACDLDNTLLHSIQWIYEQSSNDGNIDSDFLSRFHRFIRLWRKTGWLTHELDNMIFALGETDITTTLIYKMAFVNKVNTILNLPLIQLASLWGDIDTYGDNSANFPGNVSLYGQLFLSPTNNVTSVGSSQTSVFATNPLNEILSSAANPKISGHLPEIFAALSISADDYIAISEDAAPTDEINLKNLSIFYRYKLLANALNLSVADLCTLKSNCFNVDPFSSPDNTFDFIENVQKFQDAQATQTSLTVPLLNYVLSGNSKPIDDIALSQDAIFNRLPDLRAALLSIDKNDPNIQFKQSQVIYSNISSLVDLDIPNMMALLGDTDVNSLINDINNSGLDAAYFNQNFSDPAPSKQTDTAINFTWGDGLTALPANITSAASPFSVRWTGWLNAPTNADYTFTIKTGDSADVTSLSLNGKKIADITQPVTLAGGELNAIIVEYSHSAGNANIQLLWQSPTMPQATVASQFLYPASAVTDFAERITRYHRAAQAISGFALGAPEVSYLVNHTADFNPLNLLPAIPLINIQWLRLYDYCTLRTIIPAKLLLSIFQIAATATSANSVSSDELITAIANANQPNWNKEYLSYLAGNAGDAEANPPVPSSTSFFGYTTKDFRNEIALLQIKKAMDLAIKTKMPVNSSGLPAWTVIETDPATSIDLLHPVAEQIKNAVKAKYNDNWFTIATQLNNPIRENQKQALISYLLTLQLPAPDGIGADGSGKVTDADGLFEYLLIDVQMTSAVVTSRLIQATLAVQLFADRCMLGLENPEVPLTSNAINPDEWDWMKHYSVAAGLKKLFGYVENYLDPSLRDDKSPFFLDFESAIKKGDITDENVENAFRDYLYKLNEVSNMEQCGMYYDEDTQTMYVFARTHAAPYNYYFRTASNSSLTTDAWVWKPWEQVQLDIKSIDDGDNSGVHLMPVIWKKRLFLFWPEFMEKTNNPANVSQSQTYQTLSNTSLNDPSNTPQKYWEIRLAWSEYANGKWTPKKLSKEILSLADYYDTSAIHLDPVNYLFQINIDDSESLGLTLYYFSRLSIIAEKLETIAIGNFTLTDIHEKITAELNPQFAILYDAVTVLPYEPNFQSLQGPGNVFAYGSRALNFNYPLAFGNTEFLQASVEYKLLFSNNTTIVDSANLTSAPFFYVDTENKRSYFVTPNGSVAYSGPRGPIIGIITNPWKAPLSLYPPAVNPRILSFRNDGLNNISQLAAKKNIGGAVLRETMMASTENVSKGSPAAFQRQALPIINNFDNSMANQSSIAQIIAKGTQYYLPNTTFELPSFSDEQIIATEAPVLGFYTFYHPFSSLLMKRLNLGGVAALLAADTAEFPEDSNQPYISPYNTTPPIDNGPFIPANDNGDTFNSYDPDFNFVEQYAAPQPLNYYPDSNLYLENMDFSRYGTYSSYNWEIFFHAPFLIATSLSKNGKYAEARKWFHYIFNPLSTESPFPGDPTSPKNDNSPFWQVLPFKTAADVEMTDFIQSLQAGYDLNATAATNDSNKQIDQWRNDPFNAFLIARARPIAFMKNVVMAYLDNLIAWADDLFLTYIRENINEATQLYIMAAHILGPVPQYTPSRGIIPSASYNQLKDNLDDFGDAIVQLENAFPNSSEIQQSDSSVPQNLLGIGQTLYFCVPPNDKLLSYWTTVGDRLFKIRHGENIDGVVVPLALYQPPIDPALLLQAKAQGLDIAGILANLESPAPMYRFVYLLQKAKEFCNEVVSLGNAVLSANEKQDAEQLSRLRQTQEVAMLNLVTEIKTRQVLEAQANLDNLNSSRTTALQRLQHFAVELLGNTQPSVPDAPSLPDDLDENSTLPGETIITQVTSSIDISLTSTDESGVKVIPKEKQEMDDSQSAYDWQLAASSGEALAGILNLIPTFKTDLKPFGIGAGVDFGGRNLGEFASALAKQAQIVSASYAHSASQASRMSGFIRREQDWVFQANTTVREIIQLDKQIIAAQIRQQMAQHELDNHNTQIQNAQDIETFLETKFSKQELYDWMLDQLQDVHKQGYQLAYDMARTAEQAYRFELGIQTSNFVQYGYFNDAYLGITAGEQLQLALNQMDSSYMQNNVREFELVKHISIVQLDPLSLIQLRETGTCRIDLPEQLFDIDYPGHYFRRIKSVSISIPCVAGPYTTVNSTLRLQNNSLRINSLPDNDSGNFMENNIPFTAIATSSAQNDSGVFELNFRDERYLPFEGAGAISSWQLELNGKYVNSDGVTITDLSQFNYDSITDIIIHLKYTSREDAVEFRNWSITNLMSYKSGQNFTRLFSIRQEFPNQFYAFLNQPDPAGNQVLALDLIASRFPYFASQGTISINEIEILADTNISNSNDLSFAVSSNNNSTTLDCTTDSNYGALLHGTLSYVAKITPAEGLNISIANNNGVMQLNNQNLTELYLIIHYAIK